MNRYMLAAAAFSTLVIAEIASATLITREFKFSATDFEFMTGPGPAPVDPAVGQVTVTFDDGFGAENVTSGVKFNGFNFAVDTSSALPGYSFYTDFYGFGPALEVGTACTCGIGSVDQIGPNNDNFVLGIFDPAGEAKTGFFGFSQAGFQDVAFADTLAISASNVPEPATWLLMIAGLASTGVAMRRTRSSPPLAICRGSARPESLSRERVGSSDPLDRPRWAGRTRSAGRRALA